MEKPVLSVVVPAYNEASGIVKTLNTIRDVLESISASYPYEIIVVDDGSVDDTWGVVVQWCRGDGRLKAIRFSRNFGKESAIRAGLERALGQAVVVMDGDLQHPPELIPEMVRLWDDGNYQVVHGFKAVRPSESRMRRWLAHAYYAVMKRLSGYDLAGETDFKLLDRRVVNHYLRFPERALFFRGLTRWLGFRQTRLTFEPPERADGESRWDFARLFRLGIESVCAFSAVPLHLVTLGGAVMLVVSVVLGLLTLIRKFIGAAVPGFSTVILLQLFIGSLLMISLGIIGQYLGLIYEEVKRRPSFVVQETFHMARRHQMPYELDDARRKG